MKMNVTSSWSMVQPEEITESTNAITTADDITSPLLDFQAKMNAMSSLSIVLTLMSILVAFSISVITIMGLIGERCSQCTAAANAKDGGGLAGSWWRAWARVRVRSKLDVRPEYRIY